MKNNKAIIALSCIALLISCDKTEMETRQEGSMQSVIEEPQQEESVECVPFFEVAKGDTISKGVFREKPIFDEDVEIMFSTENDTQRLKAEGVSSGSGYIFNLMTSVRSSNTAPETMSNGGRTYYKIPVDLNEGAGGEWIYLYYTKTNNAGDGLSDIYTNISCCFPIFSPYNPVKLGISFGSGGWTDLNQGSGGYYIYLEGDPVSSEWAYYHYTKRTRKDWVITDVAIISSTNSMSSYKDSSNSRSLWQFVSTDLNKGAGGKYIYLCYKVTYMNLHNLL